MKTTLPNVIFDDTVNVTHPEDITIRIFPSRSAGFSRDALRTRITRKSFRGRNKIHYRSFKIISPPRTFSRASISPSPAEFGIRVRIVVKRIGAYDDTAAPMRMPLDTSVPFGIVLTG